MYVANGFKAAQRNKPKNDSEMTAGVGKMPSQTVTNRSELKALGERMGWSVRPLTMAEIRGGMSGQELIWHETLNADNYKRAMELPVQIAEGKDIENKRKAKKWWDETANTDSDETRTHLAEFKKFLDHYPQYKSAAHIDENNEALFSWLRDRHMVPIYSNLVLAFEATALEGRLWLNPSKVACGSESEVSGSDLTAHHNFHKLIQAHKRPSDLDRLSADDFLAQHDELKDKRTPPLIAARQDRANATAAHFAQAEASTAKSGSTTVTDYPDDHSG